MLSKYFHLNFTVHDLVRSLWSGVLAFVAVYWTLVQGLGDSPNFHDTKAAAIALIPAALTAALAAIKNALLRDGTLVKG